MHAAVRVGLIVVGAAMTVYGLANFRGPAPGLAGLSTLVGALGLAAAAVWPRRQSRGGVMNAYLRAILLVSGAYTAGLAFAWPFTWSTLSDGSLRTEFTPTVWMLWGLSAVQVGLALWTRRRQAPPGLRMHRKAHP